MTVPCMTDELFDAIVRIYEHQIPDIRSDEWRAEFARWEYTPVYLGPVIVALFSTMGNEIHVGVDPAHRAHWFPFKAFRKRVNELIATYGSATMRDVRVGGKSDAFIRRLGFRHAGEDAVFVHYVLRGPYVRIDPAGRGRRTAETRPA